ncbi:RNA-binding cell elongation regulator Jag/EloR [Promineifilum sp.]|uniref:RNA-binding cell elongation regulator Jag/EloR n=1 Tax=Promineifilum sp. TaxID=2664178 RepID=UPI0035B25262
MSPSSHEIESRGATVEAAVAAGLLRLGLRRDQVTVTVLDEGSRGLLGIGSREAIVRLTPSPAPSAPLAAKPPQPPPTARPPQPPPAPKPPQPPAAKPPQPPAPAAKAPEPRPAAPPRPAPTAAPEETLFEGEEAAPAPATADELTEERDTAIAVLSELLDKMRVSAEVRGYLSEVDDVTGQRVNIIDIGGADLGVLIGPRGETLDALQFIGRLMVAHKLHRRANFVVDVEGYRQRRAQALTRLAERMADKARQRGEPITLEPMSAYERRIIHMALRDAPDVYTESSGEGKQRKVRIYPKK